MLTNEGSAKVMDLGLSRRMDDGLVDDGMITGTPQYISPEQILGNDIDIRTDFYCLGASLYHMLAGKFPFEGNLQEIVRNHIQEPPVSLKKLKPEVSGCTVKVIQTLMNKKPQERYQTAAELCRDIKNSKRLLVDYRKGKKHLSLKGREAWMYRDLSFMSV